MDKNIANEVLRRANGFCEVCGSYGTQLALHHRKLKSQGGQDEVCNLIAVHHECHNLGTKSIHLNPERSRVKGWIVPSWAEPAEYPLHLYGEEVVRLDNEGNYNRIEGENGTYNS